MVARRLESPTLRDRGGTMMKRRDRKRTGRRRMMGARLMSALLGLLCAQAVADEPPKSWFQLITINAFASTSYTWNFNDPLSQTNQLRAFDFDLNSLRIDVAELVLQKAVTNPGDFGFRLDV